MPDLGWADRAEFEFVVPGLPAEPFPVSLAGLSATVTVPLDTGNPYVFHLLYFERPARWHRRHCRWCNPAGFNTGRNPYGVQYRRRQKARRRRSGRR